MLFSWYIRGAPVLVDLAAIVPEDGAHAGLLYAGGEFELSESFPVEDESEKSQAVNRAETKRRIIQGGDGL